MTQFTQQGIQEMVQVIIETVDPEQIILFGSRSRGDFRAGSDVDLLIVESYPFSVERSRKKEMIKLWRALVSFPFAKDIFVCSREEAEYWRDSLNNVVARALREGQVLYERH